MSELAIGSRIELRIERYPLRSAFRISRGAKTHADVLTATITDATHVGRGESVPYGRYGETTASVLAQAAACEAQLRDVLDPESLAAILPAGALRNALDLALWDLRAKREGQSVASLLGLAPPESVESALTLSLDAPDAMASAATKTLGSLLKIKLAGDALDRPRLLAVHAARPDARLWLDANEGLDPARYLALVDLFESLPVVLVEQPFPADLDAVLRELPRPVAICADESAHDAASLEPLADRYDAVNVKLDKSGGLTEALRTIARAKELDLQLVLGCMVSTSLALAPAFLLAGDADFVDLDGALFLEEDRASGVVLEDGRLHAPSATLWGSAPLRHDS